MEQSKEKVVSYHSPYNFKLSRKLYRIKSINFVVFLRKDETTLLSVGIG